ncbi:hypothetical protein F5X68DRAFT_260556 [Plectosphaerella plurivora]|uniref:Mitochondrial adapter protein MCP1 transmembrane domain-containing protein n=1 Tax=Plectosphaerella plurivora TaxID=936078 RepID=A0A9P8VDH1_9PEZI|nr:hypothetical protein F5X68DRAFT_260556 [Plectosphaerella plurivora]
MASSQPRPHLDERASQETLASLAHLDPAPIESPYDEDDASWQSASDPSLKTPSPLAGSTTSSMGLSGSHHGGHSAIYYLTRIQRYSSYMIPVFTSIHFINTGLIPLLTASVPSSETYLLQARELYQTTLTEPLFVFLPIAAHVASGFALRLVRRAQNIRRYGSGEKSPGLHPWPPLSWISASGYALAASVSAHVAVNRLLPLWVEGDSSNIGLAYVSHGFARHGVLAWGAYAALITTACGHMVWGAAKWAGIAPTAMGWSGSGNKVLDKKARKSRRRAWWSIQAAALALTTLWAAGCIVVATAGRADGWVAKVYDKIYDTLPLHV